MGWLPCRASLQIIGRIDDAHGKAYPSRPVRILDHGTVNMGPLSFIMANRVNGVLGAAHRPDEEHGLFRAPRAATPSASSSQTNGVTPRRWLQGLQPAPRGPHHRDDRRGLGRRRREAFGPRGPCGATRASARGSPRLSVPTRPNWPSGCAARSTCMSTPEAMFDIQDQAHPRIQAPAPQHLSKPSRSGRTSATGRTATGCRG